MSSAAVVFMVIALEKGWISLLFNLNNFLFSLFTGQEQLTKDLVLLPMRGDSLKMQKRRIELERKLSQIDEAIKIFSRPKVFIKLDS